MDWSDNYSRKILSDFCATMVNEIIKEIHSEKMEIHTEYSLSLKELGMVYRWPLYLGVNTFMERLIRAYDDKNRGVLKHYDAGINYTEYYTNIAEVCSHYYNDISLNSKLLNRLSNIISEGIDYEFIKVNLLDSSLETNTTLSNKRQYTFKSGIRYIKKIIISLYISFVRIFSKPDLIHEDSKSLNNIFPLRNRFQELPYKKLSVNFELEEY